MPTRDRPHFFRQAMRCFLSQTYRPAELIVVDDGDEPVEQVCRGLKGVEYVRLSGPTPTGTKLNIGIERARGNILQKLDDDDYYHPDFLKLAVSQLPAEDLDAALVVWDCFLVLVAGEKQARYSGHGWTAGGTFCFSRKLWKRGGFRDIRRGSDAWFIRDLQPRLIPVCAPEHYLLVRHGRNTWTLMEGEPADDFIRGLPAYPKPLSALMEAPDRAFYEGLVYVAAG